MVKGGREMMSADAQQERQRRGQQRITVMLIIVVIVFLLCQLPQAIQHLYMVYLDIAGSTNNYTNNMLKITGNVFNLLVVANCSVNFVLYSSFSSKFRMTFRRLFCRGRLCPCAVAAKRSDRKRLQDDDDAIEMSYTTKAPTLGDVSRRRSNCRQGGGCDGCTEMSTLSPAAPPRRYVTGLGSRDRKESMATLTPARYGLTSSTTVASRSPSQSSVYDGMQLVRTGSSGSAYV
jgi:hypothetical protein